MLIVIALGLVVWGSDDDEPDSPLEEPAMQEASPEAEPAVAPGGGAGELDATERSQVVAAVRGYIAALNGRDAEQICSRLAAGAVEAADFPAGKAPEGPAQDVCVGGVERNIGEGGRGGTPAWRRSQLHELKAVSVGEDRARVTATLTHDFSDRSYVSLEEDVIYLARGPDGSWLIAKPSGTFYRAVGFPEPPLRALTPP